MKHTLLALALASSAALAAPTLTANPYAKAPAAVTLTAAGGGVFVYPPGQVRAAISGSPPSGMYAQVEPVR